MRRVVCMNRFSIIFYLQDTSSGFGRAFAGNRSESTTSKPVTDSTPKKQPTILIKTREPTNEDVSKSSQKEETKANVPSSKENEGNLSFYCTDQFLVIFILYELQVIHEFVNKSLYSDICGRNQQHLDIQNNGTIGKMRFHPRTI